ncbi:MAG TPA: 7-carboxy-7-deazaguanine synthase QueE [Bacteroidales bacterium]|nr:7-carboxy-7-deazaguanine synthase QueE [Bacteroidales bacterium]
MKKEKEKTGLYLPLVEQFYSIQGEGYHTGKAAFFIRVGGCDVGCSWCDTKFAWDPEYHEMTHIDSIINAVIESGADSVVVTGGEPLMYNMDPLCKELKRINITTYLETSGSHELSGQWDWICLSPKKNLPPVKGICSLAGELKVVIQNKDDLNWAEKYRAKVPDDCKIYLQPEWSKVKEIMPVLVEYVKHHTEWSISLQSHKYMGIP